MGVLSIEERERAARYPPGRRNTFVRSRTVLRELLGQLLEVPPESLRLIVEAGKPRLNMDVDLHFSFSHSEDLAVVAIARESIGVDISRFETTSRRKRSGQRYSTRMK